MSFSLNIIFYLVCAIELFFFADFFLKLRNRQWNAVAVLAGILLYFPLGLLCCRNGSYFPLIFAVALPIAPALILAICFLITQATCKDLHYFCKEHGKSNLYAKKKVMLIVPHQDDDMNVASGILEQYVRYGSEIYVVFVTNGDYWDLAQTRLTEALRALQSIGISEDHVIFLGYAEGWVDNSVHVYNAASGVPCKSRNDYSATYALPSHPAWNDGSLYTSDNLLNDIETVILAHRPDTILCSDYDPHTEHKTTSLIFEKAMGRILKQDHGYRPIVLKAFAYCTAWTAQKDFPSLNLRSTNDPGEQVPGIYQWADRIRFPVDGTKLSRSLLQSELYHPISLYKSQRAGIAAGAIINGDKVFWQRRTDSLLHLAQIDVSSGNAGKLNDFMLFDSKNLLDDGHPPFDGVWIPDPADTQKTIHIALPYPCNIAELVLYDSPSPQDNILNAKVAFDNGYSFETNALNHNGRASSFPVNQKGIQSFTVTLLETEGECAGLSEIEAFAQAYSAPFSFIKLMSLDGDFAYDYIVNKSGTEALRLYSFGKAPSLSAQAYRITCDNPECSANISEDHIIVHCPASTACNVTITYCEDETISDSIFIRNPSQKERKKIIRTQHMEEFFHRRATYARKQTFLFVACSNISKYIHKLLRSCKHFLLSLQSGNHAG